MHHRRVSETPRLLLSRKRGGLGGGGGGGLGIGSAVEESLSPLKGADGYISNASLVQYLQAVAETTGLKAKDVKGVVEGIVAVAAGELKKNGSFKLAGALNLKLKKKPATPARKGVNPFTKEPCVFKAKPASKTVRALPMKKFKEMVN